MRSEGLHYKSVGWRLMLMMTAAAVTLLSTACRYLEPRAPQRSFTPEDLLVDQNVIPSVWETFGLVFPAGDDLCTTECASIQFGVAGRDLPIQTEHAVYRYLSVGIAQRTFEKVYLPRAGRLESPSEWTYTSPAADRSFFGCYDWAGRATPVCEWAACYEEYIVVFWVRVTPGEVSLVDIERVVEAIDERMATYLGKTSTSTPNGK
jgi:hypothetical protein